MESVLISHCLMLKAYSPESILNTSKLFFTKGSLLDKLLTLRKIISVKQIFFFLNQNQRFLGLNGSFF